jgi:general secretion pathway protein A
VRTAIRELWSRGDQRKQFSLKRRTVAGAVMVAAVVLAVLLVPGIVHRETGVNPVTALPEPAPGNKETNADVVLLETQAEDVPAAPEPAPVQAVEPMALKSYLEQADPAETRYSAMAELLTLWTIESEIQPYLTSIKDDDTYFNLVSEQQGLNIQLIEGNPELIRKLNLPGIFKFEGPDESLPIYLTLKEIQGGQAIFRAQGLDPDITISYEALVSQFKGSVYIAWKNHLAFEGIIPLRYPKGSVIMLKMLLRDMGYDHVALTPEYDKATRAIIEEIQQRNGLRVDGFVGPLTKIVLYNEKGDFPAPRLVVYEPLLNDAS